MKPTILIIEDDRDTSRWIRAYLERDGYPVIQAFDGRDGLIQALNEKPGLILLDLMLPRVGGEDVCRRIRQESDTPIIMVTAKGSRESRISGLVGGADDYLSKPFDPDELLARIHALLRRTRNEVRSQLVCGVLSLDWERSLLSVENRTIGLSRTQMNIMSTLMRHQGSVLSRRQLIEQAFDNDFDAYDRAVDTHIQRLRKLIHHNGFAPIKTVYGSGYKLECDF